MICPHCNRDQPTLAFKMRKDGTLYEWCRSCVEEVSEGKKQYRQRDFMLTPESSARARARRAARTGAGESPADTEDYADVLSSAYDEYVRVNEVDEGSNE